jgi:AcrR family transcriptional regulator
MATRGGYPKGDAKHQEILRTALEVFGRLEYSKASIAQIARECSLSRAGLAHYFPTKESLYVAVLQWRDAVDWEGFPVPDADPDGLGALSASVALVRHNMTVPGLVALHTSMTAAAADPTHPAYAFVKARNAQIVDYSIEALRRARAAGVLRAEVDEVALGIGIVGLMDGLQVRWLLADDALDMASIMEATIRTALLPGTPFPVPSGLPLFPSVPGRVITGDLVAEHRDDAG